MRQLLGLWRGEPSRIPRALPSDFEFSQHLGRVPQLRSLLRLGSKVRNWFIGLLTGAIVTTALFWASRAGDSELRARFQALTDSLASFEGWRQDHLARDSGHAVDVQRRRRAIVLRDTFLLSLVDTIAVRLPDDSLVLGLRDSLITSLAERDSVFALYEIRLAARDSALTACSALLQSAMGLARDAIRKREAPIALVVGFAATSRGLAPAFALGLRIPLPRLGL